MNQEDRSIVVVGAGAIGGVTAAFLKQTGWDVTLICKHKEIADRCSDPGLHVFGLKGEHWVKLKGLENIKDRKAHKT